MIDRWLKLDREHDVIVVCGTNRSFFGTLERFEQLRASGNDEVLVIKDVAVRS